MANQYRAPRDVLLLTQQHQHQIHELERWINTNDPQINSVLQQHASQTGQHQHVLLHKWMKLVKSRKMGISNRWEQMRSKATMADVNEPCRSWCEYWWQLETLDQLNFKRLLAMNGLNMHTIAGFAGRGTSANSPVRWDRKMIPRL